MFALNLHSKTNKNLLINIFSSYIIKGLGVLCSLLSMPLFIRYFNNQMILGVWFTLLSVLNWILVFDMGIGNGLRNHLTIALSKNDLKSAKSLISSAYVMLGIWTIVIASICCVISRFIDWNSLLNISASELSSDVLYYSIIVCLIGILLSFFLRIITAIIYSLQKSAITNLISLSSQFLILLYLFFSPKCINSEEALLNMAYVFAICSNIPLIFATILIFAERKMRTIVPHYKYVNRSSANKVLSLGVLFLVLQILYMIISVTDSWFITKFYEPSYTVIYQIYYKPFSFVSMLFMLALTPLWSAITKAYAESKFSWIIKLQRILYISFIGLIILQVLFLFLMPYFFKIWLGNEDIGFNLSTGICFTIYSTIFIWISIQSTLVAGLGKLKVQLICYIIAVVLKVGAIILLHNIFSSWKFIIIATSIALLPYCVIQPICIQKEIRKLCH